MAPVRALARGGQALGGYLGGAIADEGEWLQRIGFAPCANSLALRNLQVSVKDNLVTVGETRPSSRLYMEDVG